MQRTTRATVMMSLLSVGALLAAAPEAFAPAPAACDLSDLSIEARIPDGYVLVSPEACPQFPKMVAYQKRLSDRHRAGFYIVETTPYLAFMTDKSPSENLDDYFLVLQVAMDDSGQPYEWQRLDEREYGRIPMAELGGVCGGLRLITPAASGQGRQWRRGLLCLVQLPTQKTTERSLVQAFAFDVDVVSRSSEPSRQFQQEAADFFRSIRPRTPDRGKLDDAAVVSIGPSPPSRP